MESSGKKNWKSVKIWQKYGHEFVATVYGPPCSKLISVDKNWFQFTEIFGKKYFLNHKSNLKK